MYKENDNLDYKKIEKYMQMSDDEREKIIIEKENLIRERMKKQSIRGKENMNGNE